MPSTPLADQRTEVGAMKLSVSKKDHFAILGNDLLNFPCQLHVHFLGEVPLSSLRGSPGNGQCTLPVDQGDHESHAIAPHSASIDDQHGRASRHCRKQQLDVGQRIGLICDPLVAYSALEPLFSAFLLQWARDSVSQYWEMDVLTHDYSSNQPGKSTQMARAASFEMSAGLSQRGPI